MTQVNVGPPAAQPDGGNHTGVAAINLLTVLIVLAVVVVVGGFLFTGLLRAPAGGSTSTNVNVNIPTQVATPPAAPSVQPAG